MRRFGGADPITLGTRSADPAIEAASRPCCGGRGFCAALRPSFQHSRKQRGASEVLGGKRDHACLTGPNPCTGADTTSQDASGTVLNHVTFFPAGDEAWGTFTETGKVILTDSNGVTYTGRSTAWGTST